MSAPQISAWAKKPGAWALDAEEHQEELNQLPPAIEAASKAAAAAMLVPEAEFPSLTTAVATKEKKKKKAQKTTLTLAEFSTYNATKERGLSHEDLINLPTGPRERSAEEMERSKFDRGFGDRDGRSWRGGGGDRDRDRDEGRMSRGVSREPLGPSRADELDDWNVGKRSVGASAGGFERRGRTGGGGYFGSDSKADELDSWVSGKKSLPPVETGRRYSGLGSNGSADVETWGRKREERFENNGSSGGRPKLNLKPRSLPLSNDSRPHSPDVLMVKPEGPDVAVVKSVNPFGAARPREEVLAEKGQDWKKIDEQFESLRIKEQPGSSDSRPGSAGGRDIGSWRGNAGEEKTERSWRKSESVEGSRPTR